MYGVESRLALHHLETVGRNEDGARGFIHAVVGTPDALGKPARAFRCADMNDEIDISPVDAKIERGGGNDGASALAAMACSTLRRLLTSSDP